MADRRARVAFSVVLWASLLACASSARAGGPAEDSRALGAPGAEQAPDTAPSEIIEIIAERSPEDASAEQRAVSLVSADDLEHLVPRTTAEALLLAPGVSVQKTNHAGGSPILRGLTGQKVLLMVDGFRLSNAIMRPGPSQYLSTIDIDAVDNIEVLRGSASVLYGSDAIGGVVHVHTREVEAEPTAVRLHGRAATADRSAGGHAEINGRASAMAVRVGFGGSRFGDLRGAGPVADAAQVPIYDGDRQQFTGYDELAGHARATWALDENREVTAAVFAYRQLDAPRTDTCSPASCLVFDEQFHDLTYVRFRGSSGPLRLVDAGVAVGRVHERRSDTDHEAGTVERELDQVWSLSAHARGSLRPWRIGRAALYVTAGMDGHGERISSTAVEGDMEDALVPQLRGKFLDGSTHGTLALFGFGELRLGARVGMTAGLRLATTRSRVAADPETRASGFVSRQTLPVASAGARLHIAGPVSAVINVDRGFRAPNLYDLTARSGDAGPGYQLPNPMLTAESSVALEGGLQVRTDRLQWSGFLYRTRIRDFITREPTVCPVTLTERCGDAGAVFRMVNADAAIVRGLETAARWNAGAGVTIEGSATWTHGDSVLADGTIEPLPKVPPLHGVVVARREARRHFIELGLRWATAQRRLAPRDEGDPRIPAGGTPGHAVLDVRIGGQISRGLRATLALENLLDRPYRIHGSGVDGAGFGAVLGLAGAFR
jgi:outer membrane receptor protein involved in Fe transport